MKNSLPRLFRSVALLACAALALAAAAHSQDWAKTILNKSPRHQEWVKVTYGSRTVNAFVVYPEVSHKASNTALYALYSFIGFFFFA